MKKKANEYFKKEDYVSAMPLYSQLVSIYPKDPLYNCRFGICILYADRRETENPIKYLEFASTRPDVDISVFYYLGLAYHHNFRFAEAIKEYNLYKEKAGIKNATKMNVDRQIEICNNARNLLTHFSDLYVLQKTEVSSENFFRSYDIGRFGGKLLVKPDIFKTPLDKKREKYSLICFSKENNEVYFSSYGIDGKNGKDIYKSTKLPDGEWSKPVNLGPTINTSYDEDFPFILPDGVTLYYSSKGMNTMGGYDIFKSTLNDDGKWSTPENLNYPINTPFDDIMFMPDSSQQYAYFSSNRSSIEGMISVYKVRIDKRPQVNEILVLDKNINISSGNDTAYAQTIQFLKENATLAVNATESMFAEEKNNNDTILDSVNNKNNVTAEYGYKIPENITNDDIIKIADKQLKDALQELKELNSQKDAAKTIAQNRKLQAEAKYNEADSITKIAETFNDVNTKQTELVKVNVLHSEAEQLNKESAIAMNIADQLDEKVNIKQNEANEALSYAKGIDAAVMSNSIDTSITMLNKMTDNLEKSPVDTNLVAFNVPNNEFIKHNEKESQTLAEHAKQIQDEINSLKSVADNYRKDAADSKKKSVKEQLENNAVALDDEAKTKQAEADQILQKSEKFQSEADSAKAQSTIYANIVDDIKNNNTTSIATHTTIANNTIADNTNIKTNLSGQQADNNKIVVYSSINPTNEELKHKAEIITETENIVKSVQKEANDLKKQADIAYTIAIDKNNQSLKMSKEADNLITETNEIANIDDNEKSKKKANELQQESIILAQQSVVAYNYAKKVEVAYNEKQQESIGVAKKSADINELTNSNKINEAETKYSELQSSIVSQTKTTSITDQFQTELANSLDNKEYEIQQANEDYKLLKSKKDSLLDKSNSLKKEADNTKNKSKKNELIKQSEQIEVKETVLQKQLNEANDLSNKLEIEAGELKIKIKYTANLITEASIYKASDTSAVDKTELEKQVAQYETKNIFAEVNTENTNDIIAERDTTSNLPVYRQGLQNNSNISIDNNNIVANNVKSTIPNLTTAEKTEIKADFIDNTVAAINDNISVLQNNMSKENDTTHKEKIRKDISDLQKEAITLKQQASEAHKEAVKINGSKSVETISSVDDKILAQSLYNDSDSSLKLAAEKRIEANKTDNIAQKEKLYTEANEFEENAQVIQLEALDIYGIANKNLYYTNTLKIDKIKVEDETNNQLSIAGLLENESRYYFEKAKALRESVKNETSYTQKKPILEEAKTDEQLAIERQLKAIDIYTKVAPEYAQKNATSTIQTSTIPQANIKSVNEQLQTELSNSLDGKEYELKQANENYNLFQAKTDSLSNVVKSLRQKAEKTTNESDKNEFIKLAEQLEAQIKALQAQLNEAANLSKQLKIEIGELKPEIKNTNNPITEVSINNKVSNLPDRLDSLRSGQAGVSTVDNKTNVTNKANIDQHSVNTTKSTTTNITKTEFKGIYLNNDNSTTLNIDTANLVPLNPKLPAGIVFKVQIAALRNNVAPDVFKGITPLTGENTATGWIRYLAGLFAKFEDANNARNQIRTMGYVEAFVVAYYNGKRISVAKALAMLKNDNSLTTTYADLNNKTYITASPNINTTARLSNPIANIKGFLYSVQVGVYASPITSSQLFDITPLYDEVMANGYYRYLSGIYNSLNDAVTAKNAIIVRGVKDAFVVVYNNGNKITMVEAKTLHSENAPLAGVTNSTIETTATHANTTEIIDKSGIVYKVQLGAYKNDVPVDIVNQFIDNIAGNILEHNKNNEGFTVYTSGNFKDYDSANNFKNTLVSKGIKDAFVTAFQNNQKIAVAKAINLQK